MFFSCPGSPMITPNAAVKIRMWFARDRFSSSSSMWKIQYVHHIEYRWQGNKNSPTTYLLMGLILPSIFLFPKMKLKFLLPLKILGQISRVSSQYLASFISNSPNFKLTFKTFFPSDKRIFELFFFSEQLTFLLSNSSYQSSPSYLSKHPWHKSPASFSNSWSWMNSHSMNSLPAKNLQSISAEKSYTDGCCCSVTKLCPTLWDPGDCSKPCLSVPHHLREFAQVHVHWIGDATWYT